MRHQPSPVRVVKVGGSLLDWPELPQALDRWLARQPPGQHIMLSGGGRFADALRQASQVFSLSDELTHWLAIDCLAITAQLLATICRKPLVRNLAELEVTSGAEGVVVFDPRSFLRETEPVLAGQRLPHDWSATSDSIAARLAQALEAHELILLKSTEPPHADLPALAAAGYVDEHFPAAAQGLRTQFVGLRGT